MLTLLKTLAIYKVDLAPLPKVDADFDQAQIILTVVFSIIGALSLLFVTLGGLRYVMSQGDPQSINAAKNTVLYAVVGLVVSIMAVALVTFVLGML